MSDAPSVQMNIEHVEKFVTTYLVENLNKDNLFHNLERTKEVVSKTRELFKASASGKVDEKTLLTAAWFLHSGFAEGHDNHVKRSCQLAETYLSDNNVSKVIADKIQGYIASAWEDDDPKNETVEILRDARTAFYGSENFKELIELQRMERNNFSDDTPNVAEWVKGYIEIFQGKHRYYTPYAVEKWGTQKEENGLKLIAELKKSKKKKKKEKLKVKLKNESPERAIQSLYRTQLRNHIKLSDIADTKANILLSVNAIIISLLLSNMIPNLGKADNSYLIYPTVIFVIFSIASMIMSVLATRPKIENQKLIDEGLDDKNTNYLFFGNFYNLKLEDFKAKIGKIIESKEAIYDSLTMDLYYLGIVLKTKYRLLRLTYTVFIIGIVLSVLAFAIALKYYGMDKELLEAVTPGPQ